MFPQPSSDVNKKMSTLLKMSVLHKELSQDTQVLNCYSQVLAICEKETPPVEIPDNSLAEMAAFILGRRDINMEAWSMVRIESIIIILSPACTAGHSTSTYVTAQTQLMSLHCISLS